MPFTGSHPAAVIPLMRLGLVPSALVIGSMTPDLPYYLPLPVSSAVTHSGGGILGFDLALGLISFVVWQLLVVPLAVAAAPPSLRGRLAPELPLPWRRSFSGPRALARLVVSLWIGAATHVLWDEFTHIHRWGYRHLAWLAQLHGSLPGYRWAQYGSGVFGAAVIAYSLWRCWRTTPVADSRSQPQRVPRLSGATAAGVWTSIALAALAGSAVGWATIMLEHGGVRAALFRTATWGGSAGLAVVLACALVHFATTAGLTSRRFLR